MAINKSYLVKLQENVAWIKSKSNSSQFGGVNRDSFKTLNDAVAQVFKCCGPDCYENIYRWTDKDDNVTYVEYVFQGAKVLETEDAYKVKVANGDFNY